MAINAIEAPIEQRNTGKGNPNAILHFDVDLNNRQSKILKQLPQNGSRIIVDKKSVSMTDLSALTSKTKDEFAMFTKGKERLIIRGNSYKVDIDVQAARTLADSGYRWSGHTHPGTDFFCLEASDGDWKILEQFKQKNMAIYNSKGQYRIFSRE